MGAETERDAYDVFLINRDGSTTVLANLTSRGFAASAADLDWAGRIVRAIEAAGGAATQVGGKMVDREMILRAQALLTEDAG